jgi:hypothetical protein
MLKYHIQTIEVGSGGASAITFNNIPQTYDDLLIVASFRQNNINSPNGGFAYRPVFNNSAANKSSRSLRGSGSAVLSQTISDDIYFIGGASDDTSNTFGNSSIYVPNYTSNTAKSISIEGVNETNATAAYQYIVAGLWNNTAAITSIRLENIAASTLIQGSSASLYGIKRGSDGKTEVAAGGIITTSGGYTIHTFNSSGTFVANRDLDVEYLVVAGGGAGGSNVNSQPGGGGAGGYRSSVVGESSGGGASAEPKLRVKAGTSYPIIVGAGGAAGTGEGTQSSFDSIVSIGGGRGGSVIGGWVAPTPGGSGGGGGPSGAGGTVATGASGVAGQGFAGGSASDNLGSGGGGAGEAGNTDAVGAGGDGLASAITGTSIFRGGGGSSRGADPGLGGGGGSGGNTGTANTGGGGGIGNPGGAGGSGVVIIRYLTPAS